MDLKDRHLAEISKLMERLQTIMQLSSCKSTEMFQG